MTPRGGQIFGPLRRAPASSASSKVVKEAKRRYFSNTNLERPKRPLRPYERVLFEVWSIFCGPLRATGCASFRKFIGLCYKYIGTMLGSESEPGAEKSETPYGVSTASRLFAGLLLSFSVAVLCRS